MNLTVILDVIIAALGVYLLVSGIRGKGKFYQVQQVKEENRAEYVKAAKKNFIIIGVALIVDGVMSALKEVLYESSADGMEQVAKTSIQIPYTVFEITVLAVLAVLIITVIRMNKLTKKYVVPNMGNGEGQTGSGKPQTNHVLPVSAFEFDEEKEEEEEIPCFIEPEELSGMPAEPEETAKEPEEPAL